MNSKAMLTAGAMLAALGLFAAGVATGGAAEAANPATVTINYLSAGQCGSVSGTKNAAVYGTSVAVSSGGGVRGCTATFRVVR